MTLTLQRGDGATQVVDHLPPGRRVLLTPSARRALGDPVDDVVVAAAFANLDADLIASLCLVHRLALYLHRVDYNGRQHCGSH